MIVEDKIKNSSYNYTYSVPFAPSQHCLKLVALLISPWKMLFHKALPWRVPMLKIFYFISIYHNFNTKIKITQ